MSKVIIVGGGAAGMMAAISASDTGHQVVLYEKNEKLGKKLFITGKGRCNITNDSDVENLLKNVMKNPKFLYSAFYTFDSAGVMDFLQREGLALKTERGNRVFPESDKSSDVIQTLQRAMKKRGVEIHLNTEVKEIAWEEGVCKGVILEKENKRNSVRQNGKIDNETKGYREADAVIVATGGISYPSTGSTGDGYQFARKTSHQIQQTYPSLVPFNVKEEYIKELQGLSLKNVTLCITKGKKCLYEEMGEMLFTHFGVSGPLVLSASSVLSGKDLSEVQVVIDLKPALSVQQLDERVLRDFKNCQNSFFKNSLQKLLPAKMIPVIVGLSQIPSEKKVNEITREERQQLVSLLKEFPFTIESMRGYNEAIITRGGVSVKDINPATMESRLIKGLYFAGEVLDLDARTGGYNLQIAWSTGYLAGISVE